MENIILETLANAIRAGKKKTPKMTQLNVLIDYDCLPEISKIIE